MTISAPRITTPFTEDSTAAEVIAGVDLTGKRAIVTGASSGLGVETARALASAGAEVTLAVRDVEAGKRIATEITSKTGNKNVFVEPLNLNSHASIAAFTKAWKGPLHILVNNAGIAALPDLTLTPEGWEQQFATNHLGHFELALGLHEALAAAGNARVVSVSSRGHCFSPIIVFDDIHYTNRKYDDLEAYGQSKTANVLFAVEGSKRWAKDGITVNACHPGAILTNIQRYVKPDPQRAELMKKFKFKSVEQGSSTQVWLATSPLVEGIGGRYFEDNNEAEVVPGRDVVSPGCNPQALDAADAAKLWDVSLEMLKRSTV